MLVDEYFDDEFGHIILAGIQMPDATIIIAAHVELIRVVPNYFC